MRLLIAACAVFLCLCAIWVAGAAGLSRLFADYARGSRQMAAADWATRLGPKDPAAHVARALVLRSQNRFAEAQAEFERAVALRPRDYVLWYELALSRSAAGDMDGAMRACEEAVRLAPFYGRTHWLLGNLLYRAGRRDEAFKELRRAATSDPESLPSMIDLAWGTYAGDARAVEAVVQPITNGERIALAQFFARKGKYEEAVALFRAAGDASEADRQKLLTELLSAGSFTEAYEVWSLARQETAGEKTGGVGQVTDPGFEGAIKLSEPGFGWRQSAGLENVRTSLDTNAPHGGARSIAFEFNGNSNPASPILSQIVLVEPDASYRLSFAARTEEIVTGGPPQVTVSELSGAATEKLLGAAVLPAASGAWREYSIEFTTGRETRAIIINVNRQSCSATPCPAFGRQWLDDFSLQKRGGSNP